MCMLERIKAELWGSGMALLTERYAKKIAGVLGCYDRVVIQGTLPGICFAEGNDGISEAEQDTGFSIIRNSQNHSVMSFAKTRNDWRQRTASRLNSYVVTKPERKS